MIKALIIDDETHVRLDIREKLIENFGKEVAIVGEVGTVASGLEAIEKFEPELILLDIHLPDGTGFDLMSQTKYKSAKVIFVTGFDEHAIKAVKVGALDYILKPVDEDELKEAIQKALDGIEKDHDIENLIKISSEYFQGVKQKRIILKTADNVYAIYEDDILYCKSDGNYTTFYTQQLEKIVVSKPMKKIQEILSEDVFIRCHQSYIVNKKHVLKYNKQGVLVIHLDIKVPVSSRRKDYALKKIFN